MDKLTIVDDGTPEIRVIKAAVQIDKLSDDFGRNLDTIAKARQWLTNPHNWFRGTLFILKWDGLLPTICERHGQRLIDEPHDDGLPIVVVCHQWDLRNGKKDPEFDDVEE